MQESSGGSEHAGAETPFQLARRVAAEKDLEILILASVNRVRGRERMILTGTLTEFGNMRGTLQMPLLLRFSAAPSLKPVFCFVFTEEEAGMSVAACHICWLSPD